MAKATSNGFLDAMLDAVAGSTTLSICSAEPANQAAVAGLTLASVVVSAGDFTKANGDTSGRKVTIAQQANMAITQSGSANHVVLGDGTDIHVTICTTQVLTSGGTVTNPAYDIEVADPV